MDNISNAVKAVVIVLGFIALVALLLILLPLVKAIGGILLGLLAVIAVPAAIVGCVYLVYRYLQSRREPTAKTGRFRWKSKPPCFFAYISAFPMREHRKGGRNAVLGFSTFSMHRSLSSGSFDRLPDLGTREKGGR